MPFLASRQTKPFSPTGWLGVHRGMTFFEEKIETVQPNIHSIPKLHGLKSCVHGSIAAAAFWWRGDYFSLWLLTMS